MMVWKVSRPMRPFLIDDNIKEKLNRLVEHAEQNIFEIDDLLDQMNDKSKSAGNDPDFCCTLPFGYLIIYSMFTVNEKTYRQMTVAVDTPGKLPSVPVVSELCRMTKFKYTPEDAMVDDFLIGMSHDEAGQPAIRVVEVIT